MKIVALVPAFNESQRIGATIEAILKIEQIHEVVVIDDGSVDETVEVVEKYIPHHPVKLIQLLKNSGKGQALNAGWREYPADIYLLLDADLQESATLAEALLPPLLKGEADMTIADFISKQVIQGSGKMGFGLAKSLARLGIRLLTGYHASSPLSGQRAVSKDLLQACSGFAPGFGVEVDLTIRAVRSGFKVLEIGVPMTHRATGRNLAGFIHRGKQLWMIARVLFQAWRNG